MTSASAKAPHLRGFRNMRRRGLEPPRAIRPTRPSTLRVYQFRHRREGAASIAPDLPEIPGRSGGWGECLFPSDAVISCEHTFELPLFIMPSKEPAQMDLTKRQQEIFDFIKRYAAEHGYPPTVRDIGKAVGLASSSTVHAHLANLERLGML